MSERHRDHGYVLLVNSTDSFEDCWVPFFTLLKSYWPEPRPRIILNTESKDFTFPGLDICCAQVGRTFKDSTSTWSECLAACLDAIDGEVILYMQDDYFLSGPVKIEQIRYCVDVLQAHAIACIRLMECGNAGPWTPSEYDGLWNVDQRARYRISLQAGLWRKAVLRRYLRSHENAWQLEIHGSRRAARRRDDRVLCVDRERYSHPDSDVVPYTPTGIVKGKWNAEAVTHLFESHGIKIDYSIRGLASSVPSRRDPVPLMTRVLGRVKSAF